MVKQSAVEPVTRRARGAGATGRTQAERRATSQRRLLDAAARVVADRGTTSVSFAEIAKAAGCSHGLPGYLFGSKTEMLLALLDEALARFRDEVVPASMRDARGLDALLGWLDVYIGSLDRPLPYTRAIYVMIGEDGAAPAELRRALNAHHDAVRALIRSALVDGVERGEVRPDVDGDAAATALFGMLRGIGTLVLLDPESVDVKALRLEVLASTRRALAT
ncbi:MAG: TetR/AcrR family transcriptional regulator [Acidimicrobiales bacterium]